MTSLPIVWQRLVNPAGKTCDRCSATHREMQRAVRKLRTALRPLGIEPTMVVREISERSFKANPSESNRIWIAGKPMEEWLGATVGSSRCCSVCGESECRTLELKAGEFEAIPEALFLKAALAATSELLEVTTEAPSRSRKPSLRAKSRATAARRQRGARRTRGPSRANRSGR